MTIRVVLADDQALIRSGFRVLIDSAEDLEVVGEAASGDDAVRLARSTRADVVLMDIRMPGTDGIAATRAITDDDDLAGVKVVVLTTFEIDAYVIEAVRAGASGFLTKSIEPADLLDAIRTVAGGDALLSPRATQALLAEFATAGTRAAIPADRLADLTTREREMMTLAAHGLSNTKSPDGCSSHRSRSRHISTDDDEARRPRPCPTRGSRLPERPRPPPRSID